MSPHDYDFLCKLLKEQSGLALAADKQYLVESRLLPLARKAGLASLADLVAKLKNGGERLAVEVVHAMTTNESFFFRDKIPFDHFRDTIMPGLLTTRAAERRIRIWCAAASTGQEPYSLAICLKEMRDRIAGWRIEMIGTDLSTAVLEKAKAGLYTQFEVQRGLPIQLLVKHFAQVGEMWQIAADVRAMVQYRPLNLLSDFSHLGAFDLVFCRNVLIYFDQDTKVAVLNRLARVTAPHGYLVLGAAETVVGLTDAFKPVPDRRGLYAPASSASATGVATRVAAMAPRVTGLVAAK
ncbi:MAG TPA: protein-glutamate O-methyltransferase CheR [Xanthobacteraceae bacterium]|nr:protein-glutamate O-methyltransferase CheR [Xanthobacteraceae bacterium]